MQFCELFFRHLLGAFEDAAGAIVGLTHLAFLIVCEGEDAQGKNFVDLG